METVNELSGVVQDKKKGDKIKLEVLRDKKPLSVDVVVDEEESGGAFMVPARRFPGHPLGLRRIREGLLR